MTCPHGYPSPRSCLDCMDGTVLVSVRSETAIVGVDQIDGTRGGYLAWGVLDAQLPERT